MFKDARSALANKLGDHLRSVHDARPLTAADLQVYKNREIDHGWRIPGDPPFFLLLDAEFPYAPPKISLYDDTYRLIWPHVENDGVLCVLPAQTNIDTHNPQGVADELIAEARGLVERSRSDDLASSFREEFHSYWMLSVDERAPFYRSLVLPRGPTRKIRVWRGKRIRIFGETDEALATWLANAYGAPPKEGWLFHDALLAWLARPLTPAEYPESASDIETLLHTCTPNGEDILPLVDISQPTDLLIGAPAEVGACFGAVYLEKLDKKKIEKGFRPGHVPVEHIKRHAMSPARKARKGLVERVDSSWIHGRDHDENIARLADTRVAVIGCGALGASVAVLLAQAGVGRLRLFDGESLDPPNTARHPLGARQIGENKAKSLAEHISARFPHMMEIEAVREDLVAANVDSYSDISQADLIVSATGEWASMSLIADAAKLWKAPLQTIWHEPQALAAHSVVTLPHGPCLRCGFDSLGRPRLEAILHLQADIWRQVPACGGAFTPYGAVDLAHTSGFCAAESLKIIEATPVHARHAIWTVNEERLKSVGARYTDDFVKAFTRPSQGGVFNKDWLSSGDCRSCMA